MSKKIKVRLVKRGVTNAKLKPKNGIKVKDDTTYLYDPTLIADFVDLAEDWATKTDGKVEEDGEQIDYSAKAYAIGGTGTETNNAKYYSEQASDSATSASNSATTATTQAGIATTQAGIATTKAGQAATSEYNAEQYSISAGSSATNAFNSASNAYSSEVNASSSASTATTQAGIATTQAGLASGYATSASGSASSASTSATNAQTWAEGTDVQVSALGGEHSSKGWADISKHWAESIGSALIYRGSVATYADLPSSDQKVGDFYNVLSDGSNYAWDGTGWDAMSGIVDLSVYRTSADQDIIDSGKVPTTRTVNGKALSSDVSLTASDVGALPDSTVVPTINSTNNYVPYRSGASTFANSTLMYNSNAMAFTGRLHVGSSSPASYYNKGKFTIYDNTPSQQVSSLALLNYGGGGGCGVAIDMYNTSANGGIPSGRFGVIDNGNYSGYLQLQVKKSGAQSNPLLPAMNIVPVPATNSLTTCVSFGQDEFNRVLFDLHKPESTVTITDSDKRWGGSGTTYKVTGNNKFNTRLLVAVGDIVSFDSFATEATVTGVVSNSTTCQITTNVSLGTISNKNISVKKAYFKITDENNNIKVYVNPYGKFGIGTGTPAYDLDVAGSINASTDVKVNGTSVLTGITGTMVTNALGYTPYDSSNPSGYTPNVGTVTSVNNVSPVNGNVSLSIPTVNNPTITITQGGVTKGSFTLNQSSGDTIALDAGGNTTRAGTVILYAGDTAPTGYLICDGSVVSRTTYSELFSAIGTKYGSGDGSTTFKIPDFVGRVVQGGTAGTYKNAGLPNITGKYAIVDRAIGGGGEGALYSSSTGNTWTNWSYAGSGGGLDISFDASRSNSIYGNSNTVQPPALCVNMCIKY